MMISGLPSPKIVWLRILEYNLPRIVTHAYSCTAAILSWSRVRAYGRTPLIIVGNVLFLRDTQHVCIFEHTTSCLIETKSVVHCEQVKLALGTRA